MSGWVLGLSMVVTYFSSIGFIALTGKAFSEDWRALMFDAGMIGIVFLAVKFFIPYHRKNKSVSSFTHLGERFGPWATVYALAMHGIAAVIRMGIMLFLVAKALSFVTGWSETHIIYMVGIITILYTCSGGLKSVIWTDAMQFGVMILGTTLILGFLIYNIPGGVGEFCSAAVKQNKFSLGDFSLSLSRPTFWVLMLTGFFMNLQSFAISPAYVQRYIAARSTKEAQRAMVWSFIAYMGLLFIFFLVGTALFVYYQAFPELLPREILAQGGDSVYSYFIANGLPVGLKGIMISAILAAAMSSIDSSVNSLSMLYLVNIHKPFINEQTGRKGSMRILYISSAIVGGLAIMVAVLFREQTSVLDAWYLLSSLFMGSTLGLFILGYVCRSARRPEGILAVIAGTLVVIWSMASPCMTNEWEVLKAPFHGFMTFTISTLVVMLVGLVVRALRGLITELNQG